MVSDNHNKIKSILAKSHTKWRGLEQPQSKVKLILAKFQQLT